MPASVRRRFCRNIQAEQFAYLLKEVILPPSTCRKGVMGFRIFAKSLNQIWLSPGTALQIGGFWYGLFFSLILVRQFLDDPFTATLVGITTLIVMVCGLSLIAIGWHRFVLRQEAPRSFVGMDRTWPFFPFLWTLFKLALAVILPLFAVSIPLFMMASQGGSVGSVGSVGKELFIFLTGSLAIWLILRLGLVLPATAIGEKLTLRESFALTRPVAIPLVVTTVLMMLLQSIPQLILTPTMLLDETSILRTVILLSLLPVGTVVGWLSVLVLIGVL
ncbi:MAG: hypothetical protein AAGF82_19885, partial [Pseudomonadota bacterium]